MLVGIAKLQLLTWESRMFHYMLRLSSTLYTAHAKAASALRAEPERLLTCQYMQFLNKFTNCAQWQPVLAEEPL